MVLQVGLHEVCIVHSSFLVHHAVWAVIFVFKSCLIYFSNKKMSSLSEVFGWITNILLDYT